jgi:glycosyltransferase involved in cell wall biosynthesis
MSSSNDQVAPTQVLVSQIGAREHYAIACALRDQAVLAAMITDFWVPKKHWFRFVPGLTRLRDRHLVSLASVMILAPNIRMLYFELRQRINKRRGWSVNIARNGLFQKFAISKFDKLARQYPELALFSYSYAARDLFGDAKKRGWETILGQIDPGPEEERIVAAEHERYPELGSRWRPAPADYWKSWREEIDLADIIIVNSEWSKQCLIKEGVDEEKLEVVPLVYESKESHGNCAAHEKSNHPEDVVYRVLFLGQINLRKGIARLLEAMRLLQDETIQLTLAGPCEIDPESWADLPNVEWLGSVPRSEVGRLYDEADVFILPTLSDGYAITQLEALSRGLPVIASAHCGAAVNEGVNGWILADLEPETIAGAITRARVENLKPVSAGSSFTPDQLGQRLVDLIC